MCITFYTVRFLSHDVGGTGFCSAVLAELICPEAWKSRMIAAACHCLRIYHPEVDLVQVDDLHNGLDMAQFLNQRQDGPLFAEIPCEDAPLACVQLPAEHHRLDTPTFAGLLLFPTMLAASLSFLNGFSFGRNEYTILFPVPLLLPPDLSV